MTTYAVEPTIASADLAPPASSRPARSAGGHDIEAQVGRFGALGALAGLVLVTAGVTGAGVAGGMGVGAATGLGAFAGIWSGVGFGFMMGASVAARHH